MVADALWREAARRVLGTLDERSALDVSGLTIPQAALVSSLTGGDFRMVGTVTYCCHTCGDLITRPWEVFYVDDTPGREWASDLTPPKTTPRTTTHHVGHLHAG